MRKDKRIKTNLKTKAEGERANVVDIALRSLMDLESWTECWPLVKQTLQKASRFTGGNATPQRKATASSERSPQEH